MVWCSFTLLVAVLPAAAAPQESGMVRVSYTLVNADPTVHEPVFVRVSLKNGMDSSVKVDLGPDFYGSFEPKLVRPDGRTGSWQRPWSVMGAPGTITVPAHGEAVQRLLLNRWFDLDVPGRYLLALDLLGKAPLVDGAPAAYLTKGEVEIEVGPRNPSRLEEVCEQLEEAATGARDLDGAWEPTQTLTYVRDPIAVPHLARLLAAKGTLRAMLIRGLEGIGDPAAADALISWLQETGDADGAARAALTRIQAKSDDPALKQKILAALAVRN